jgi:signal transduction histidine kinase
MRQGMDYSHKAQLKSERLKTELITNVSHDLRTPLTSIMTYSELLKKEDISEEERKKYIDIVEQKSKRLKVLIDDLFEVSKMASGNIELVIERVDIVQLMNQALGEYDEKIKESSLAFKVSSSSPHIYAMVDGRKMWRVFDNIISNILKYSLENTRVYISTKETDNNIIISFKNISKYELEENIVELLERFKRGDKSRNTEGSGLGLAIAQSIVDNHGGKLDIELDGDLFKTIVTLKK